MNVCDVTLLQALIVGAIIGAGLASVAYAILDWLRS